MRIFLSYNLKTHLLTELHRIQGVDENTHSPFAQILCNSDTLKPSGAYLHVRQDLKCSMAMHC